MNDVIEKLIQSKYENKTKISKELIINLLNEVRCVLFPGFFEDVKTDKKDYIHEKLLKIKNLLRINLENVVVDTKIIDEIINSFINSIPVVKELLESDIEAFIDSDPAATSFEEVILCYPGLYAISVYRISNILYNLKVPNIPRVMTEYAHALTGIDINPGATIGHHFFIDHGTGIVIGETTVIGNYVKIYQGVTLGAISLNNASKLKGKKRHPTIGNHVTIYAGASILGGDTIIGDNVTIGSNTFITKPVENDKIIVYTDCKYVQKDKIKEGM